MTELRIVIADAEARHRKYPRTFQIPPRALRRGLQPGHFAKLVFEPSPNPEETGERMWVEVTEIRGAGRYRGRLDSRPATWPFTAAHRAGDRIDFGAEHVIDVMVR
ncbi:MAG TPA: hypothetical protein VJT85_00040 [Gemmatimonadaceae bacterium]|nr:hypothetical protein [Gemmatimonadaceae bacterium]